MPLPKVRPRAPPRAVQSWHRAHSGGAGEGRGASLEIKTLWLQHFLSPGLGLLQVGGAARGCGGLWGAPGDPCALVFSTGVAQYVQAFDALLAGPVAEYTKISREVGGDVQKHVRTPVPPLLQGCCLSLGLEEPHLLSESAFL